MRVTDQVLIRYLELQNQIKELETEMRVLKDAIMRTGGVNTKSCMAVIKTQFREYVAGRGEFDVKFGSEWLTKNGMLKHSEFPVLTVVRKKVA